jgi:uncharacterized membrane protein
MPHKEKNMSENDNTITGSKKTSMGLDENVEGALCYVLGFVTGIVFLLMEKDNKFVKFHAIQSIVISLILIIVNMLITTLLYSMFSYATMWLAASISSLISLVGLAILLVLIIKAFQGEMFKLPVIGDIAEKHSQT